MFLFTTPDVTSSVPNVIRQACRRTGMGFDYLLKPATRESALDPQAKARTSSAAGLFQFVENTWLGMIKTSGAKHGYGDLAAKIEKLPNGGYRVPDAAARKEIMALRYNASASALMAGEFTAQNADALRAGLKRAPNDGELYIAHFMGADGAIDLIRLAGVSPNASAASRFPKAANANRSIFYTDNGRSRSAANVYETLVAKHGAGPRSMPDALPAERQDGPLFHGIFANNSALGTIARSTASLWSGLGLARADDPSVPVPARSAARQTVPLPSEAPAREARAPVAEANSAPSGRFANDPSLPVG